ncbi:MAG: tetraprenyl-beta-curcumene synthase family protein [Bacillota bacterium]
MTQYIGEAFTISVNRLVPTQVKMVARICTGVLPRVKIEMDRWQRQARQCPDDELTRQALSSLRLKRFHAQGGSVYSAYNPQYLGPMTAMIVAFQTISDYLDNLCDRAGVREEAGFSQLHLSMLDALDPDRLTSDYYRYYPYRHDGGYLTALVEECRLQAGHLPAYTQVKDEVTRLTGLYTKLQIYKHLELDERESRLISWIEPHLDVYPDVHWWEFAAATGSTLGVFALWAAATNPDLTQEETDNIIEAYFPWICGLHILLDYFIDQEEDRHGGDLNFVSYYGNDDLCHARLLTFLKESLRRAASLPQPAFHLTVVRGLLGMYLSDPKISLQGLDWIAQSLLSTAGSESRWLFRLCKLLRRCKVI